MSLWRAMSGARVGAASHFSVHSLMVRALASCSLRRIRQFASPVFADSTTHLLEQN